MPATTAHVTHPISLIILLVRSDQKKDDPVSNDHSSSSSFA